MEALSASVFLTESFVFLCLNDFSHKLCLLGSFRTGERKIAAKPEKVPILHKIVLGNVPGNVPGPFFGKKCENPRYFFFLTFWCHLKTLRSSPFFFVPPGITFCALSFLFLEMCVELTFPLRCIHFKKKVITAWREKMMTDECWLLIDHWSLMIDD